MVHLKIENDIIKIVIEKKNGNYWNFLSKYDCKLNEANFENFGIILNKLPSDISAI